LQIQTNIDKTILKAPVSGTITAVEKKKGETAQMNAAIISMINSGQYQIEANISETDIAKIKLHDTCEMTLDALGPKEKFTGQIVKIDPAETIVSGVIYYKITSIFDSEDGRIKSGMTVNMDIVTEIQSNVIMLPYYVIKQRNGDKYVLVMENGKAAEKIIMTGLEGETMVEIISGLKEGEEVAVEK
jgi:HlyD family secretion protein